MFLHELCKIGHPISHSAHRIFLAAIYKHLMQSRSCKGLSIAGSLFKFGRNIQGKNPTSSCLGILN